MAGVENYQEIGTGYPVQLSWKKDIRNVILLICASLPVYPLNVLHSFIETDSILSVPNIQNITNEVLKLKQYGQFTQELTAQIQSADNQSLEITQGGSCAISECKKQ